jgi:DNA-binding NarL/FixJ family response regulator
MKTLRILIIDDSYSIIVKLMNLLKKYNHSQVIGYASSYEDAVYELARNEIDLVLLDIRIPGGSGLDLINFIKYRHPSAKVAMFTNYSYKQMRQRSKELGADYFFDKSLDLDRVIKMVAGKIPIYSGLEGI